MEQFLTGYGVRHETSSYLPCRRNSLQNRMYSGKIWKRIVLANLSADGSLDKDNLAHALFIHRNQANPESGLSPSEIIFCINLHGNLPLKPQDYKYFIQSNTLSNPLTSKKFPDNLFWFFYTKIPKPFLIQNKKGKKETIYIRYNRWNYEHKIWIFLKISINFSSIFLLHHINKIMLQLNDD